VVKEAESISARVSNTKESFNETFSGEHMQVLLLIASGLVFLILYGIFFILITRSFEKPIRRTVESRLESMRGHEPDDQSIRQRYRDEFHHGADYPEYTEVGRAYKRSS